ncbi:MAG: hypothetical protein RIS76_3322 [Verrucomicrobiota bacterium]
MAWRIHDSVLRGEIDNRIRGIVRGCLWMHGVEEPVRLELAGNACADLAGCALHFENPGPTTPLRQDVLLAADQRGCVGDITASRKVRIFDVPIHEACEQLRRGEKPPEHLANCLYLEWFSTANGRMVVESADYRLELSAPEWRLDAQEEEERQATVQRGWTGFLEDLTEAVTREQARLPSHKDVEFWDEFDYEQFLRESDACTAKLMALYDRYEGNLDADAIIAREMGWDPEDPETRRKVAGRLGPRPPGLEPVATGDPHPASEGVDWVRDEYGTPVHPLYLRCLRARREVGEAVDRVSEAVQNDPEVSNFICAFHLTTARLAGALNGLAHGRRRREAAFIVACLKRSTGHLQEALPALGRIRNRGLLSEEVCRVAQDELAAIEERIQALVLEFRRIAESLE